MLLRRLIRKVPFAVRTGSLSVGLGAGFYFIAAFRERFGSPHLFVKLLEEKAVPKQTETDTSPAPDRQAPSAARSPESHSDQECSQTPGKSPPSTGPECRDREDSPAPGEEGNAAAGGAAGWWPSDTSIAVPDAETEAEASEVPEDVGHEVLRDPGSASSTGRAVAAGLGWLLMLGTWVLSSILPFALVTLGSFWATHGCMEKTALLALGFGVACWLAPHVPPLPLRVRHEFFATLRSWFPSCERHWIPLPSERALYCLHPHGVFSIGVAVFCADLIENPPVILTAPFLSKIAPLMVAFLKLIGYEIAPAREKEIRRLMAEGRPLVLMPGGFQEIALSAPGRDRVYLQRRRGFIRLALAYGYTIVPAYTIGESDTYLTSSAFEKARTYLSARDIPCVFPFGWTFLPLLPRRVPLTQVIGPCLKMPESTAKGDIEFYHARYVASLRAMLRRVGRELEVE